MSWKEKIEKPVVYVSPSGKRISFQYEGFSSSFEKKTGSFEFPSTSGTLVQDLGHTGRRFPFVAFFSGDDYDTAATAFESALQEKGIGTLEHPLYGIFKVVPFGPIGRRDDLVTAANQAVYDVTFWETIETSYPAVGAGSKDFLRQAMVKANNANSSSFADKLKFTTPGAITKFKAKYNNALGKIKDGLGPIVDKTESLQKQFSAISQSIETGLDETVGTPGVLGSQTIQLIQTASGSSDTLAKKLLAFSDLAQETYNGITDDPADFFLGDLLTTSILGGSILAIVDELFGNRSEAITSADDLATQFDAWTTWRDTELNTYSEIDSGESYQATQEALFLSQGYLIETAFDLAQERSLTLSSPRSAIDLCGELYGKLDDETLNFFINGNSLTGSEIYDELKAGRRVLYYI